MTSGRRRTGTVGAVLVSLLLVAGCAAPAPESATERRIPLSAEPAPTATSSGSREVLDALAARLAPAPARLEVPELDIAMSILPTALDSRGDMAIPVSAFDAGWYQYSAAPGASQGAMVIASHVFTVAEGEGPFLRLLRAEIGQSVTVIDSEGVVHRYRITTIEQIAKDAVPLDRIFTTVGPAHLVLVTCGGDYDTGYAGGRGRYEDNVIVTALRVP
jgi:hypothetical protein